MQIAVKTDPGSSLSNTDMSDFELWCSRKTDRIRPDIMREGKENVAITNLWTKQDKQSMTLSVNWERPLNVTDNEIAMDLREDKTYYAFISYGIFTSQIDAAKNKVMGNTAASAFLEMYIPKAIPTMPLGT